MNNKSFSSYFNFSNVIAVAKKEVKSFFDLPTAYVLLVIFTGLSFFFFFQIESVSHEASLRTYFELLPWFFLFFVPAVTMRSFSEEYRRGTIETLLTSPVTNAEVVIGKFLGSFIFAISPLAISLLLPISFSRYASLDFGLIFGQYIGALLLAASFAALGLWMSSLTKSQIAALLSAIVVGFFFMIINSDIVTINLPQSIGDILNQLSIMSHMLSISRGVIDFRDIAFFIGFIAIFIMLSYMALNRWLGYARDLKFTYIATAVVAIVVILNIAAAQLPLRLDLTRGKVYTLSQATLNVLNQAKGPIEITVYASEQLPPQIKLVSRDVWDIINDYRRYGGGKITVKKVDPSKDDKIASEAMSKGINPVQFNVMSRGEFKVNQGYFGLSIEKGKDYEVIPFIQQIADIEYQISSAIAKLSKTKRPQIAMLTGHGEDDMYGDYQLLNQEIGKIADVETFSIESTTTAIPAKYDMLFVLNPKEDLKDKDANLIDNYVKAGGTAVILHDPVQVNLQYLMADKSKALFEKLYKKWGIKIRPELVYDLRSNMQVTAGTNMMQVITPYPYWVNAQADSTKPLTNKIEAVALPWASPITIRKDKPKDISITKVLVSTDASGLVKDNFVINPLQAQFAENNLSTHTLAVVVKNGKGQALIVGDADFTKNQFIQRNSQNLLLILNAVDVFTQSQGLSEIKSKQAGPTTLKFQSPVEYEFLRYSNIAFGCLIIIVLGAIRLMRRKQRQTLKYVA